MKNKLRENIVNHLKLKGNYDETVDDYLIDMILENMQYALEMKRDLDTNGCVIQMRNGNNITTTKMNPSFGVYQMCLRNIHQASAKLGISRSDRLKLKIIEAQEKDKFDELMNC